MAISKVRKRDGMLEELDYDKITNAIFIDKLKLYYVANRL